MAVVKILGFSGSGFVDSQQVLMTSGSMQKDVNIPYIQPVSIPAPDGTAGGSSRTRVKYAEGTSAVTGSMSFDVNEPGMGLLTLQRLLKRGFSFPVIMFDGETGYSLENCYVTSLSISGAINGLLNANLSFIGLGDWKQTLDNEPAVFNRPDAPIGYWATGNVNVKEWTLNYNQSAEPVYLNQKAQGGVAQEDDRFPRYIKTGLVEYSLDVTTYEEVIAYDEVIISTSKFALKGATGTSGYNFGGPGDLGTFTHSFQASASLEDGSGGVIIESVVETPTP